MASRCARVSGAGKGPRRAASRWSPAPSEPGTGPPRIGGVSGHDFFPSYVAPLAAGPDHARLQQAGHPGDLAEPVGGRPVRPAGKPHRVQEKQPQWHAGLGYQDRELFDLYLRLPVPKRRLVRDVILAIARAHAHAAEEAERNAHS